MWRRFIIQYRMRTICQRLNWNVVEQKILPPTPATERNREERENKSHTRFKYDTIYSDPLRIQTEWLHQLRLFASVYLLKIEFAYK